MASMAMMKTVCLVLFGGLVVASQSTSKQNHASLGALSLGGNMAHRNEKNTQSKKLLNLITNGDVVDLIVSSATNNETFFINDDLLISWVTLDSSYAPVATDWIAFYCGEDVAQVSDSSYLDYIYVSDADSNDWSNGFGDFNALLTTSGRLPQCQFRMFANNGYSLLGTSNLMKIENYGNPSQVHIALTGVEGEMLIHWTSVDSNPGAVYYALVSNISRSSTISLSSDFIQKELISPHSYEASDMCESPATNEDTFVNPGWLHEIILTNLKSNSFYTYYIEDYSGLKSQIFNFQAPPNVGPIQESFSYIVYGDMGVTGGDSATETASLGNIEINEYGARMTHHIGDISYARGNSQTWEAWFPLVQPYAATAPCSFRITSLFFRSFENHNK